MINLQLASGKREDLLVSCFFFVWFVWFVVPAIKYSTTKYTNHTKRTRKRKGRIRGLHAQRNGLSKLGRNLLFLSVRIDYVSILDIALIDNPRLMISDSPTAVQNKI